MAEGEVIVKTKVVADTSGAERAEKALGGVGNAAKRASRESVVGAANAESAFGRFRGAIAAVRNVLTGFGVVGVFSMLASAVGKVTESFGAAKKEAEELAKAKDKAAHAKEVEDLAKAYEQLGESMRKASEAMQRANELEDIATRNARALEDAQMDLAKQKELAAIDPNDPAAAEKRAQIEADYAARRGHLTADRSREDLDRERNRLQAAASAKRNEAADIEALAKNDDAVIADVRRRLADARNRSEVDNDEDRSGFWEHFGGNVKAITTFNWGKVGESRTEAGDAIRKEAKSETERLEAELKQLESQREAKLKQAADIRAEGEQMQQKSYELQSGYKVIDVREQATGVETSRGVIEADNALDKKEKRIAKDRATVAEGRETLANFEQTEAEQRAKAKAAADKYEREQADVAAAQNRYDMIVANGGSRKERSAALAALQKERDEALEAQHEMETVAAEVANVLKAIKEEVSTLSHAVKSAQSRLAQNQTDAPEG